MILGEGGELVGENNWLTDRKVVILETYSVRSSLAVENINQEVDGEDR